MRWKMLIWPLLVLRSNLVKLFEGVKMSLHATFEVPIEIFFDCLLILLNSCKPFYDEVLVMFVYHCAKVEYLYIGSGSPLFKTSNFILGYSLIQNQQCFKQIVNNSWVLSFKNEKNLTRYLKLGIDCQSIYNSIANEDFEEEEGPRLIGCKVVINLLLTNSVILVKLLYMCCICNS